MKANYIDILLDIINSYALISLRGVITLHNLTSLDMTIENKPL